MDFLRKILLVAIIFDFVGNAISSFAISDTCNRSKHIKSKQDNKYIQQHFCGTSAQNEPAGYNAAKPNFKYMFFTISNIGV